MGLKFETIDGIRMFGNKSNGSGLDISWNALFKEDIFNCKDKINLNNFPCKFKELKSEAICPWRGVFGRGEDDILDFFIANGGYKFLGTITFCVIYGLEEISYNRRDFFVRGEGPTRSSDFFKKIIVLSNFNFSKKKFEVIISKIHPFCFSSLR